MNRALHSLPGESLEIAHTVPLATFSVPFITIYKLLFAQGDKVSVLNRQLSLNVSGHTERPAGTTGTLNKRPQNIFNHNILK